MVVTRLAYRSILQALIRDPGHSLITVDTRINQTQEMRPAGLPIISYELMTLGVNYVHNIIYYSLHFE